MQYEEVVKELGITQSSLSIRINPKTYKEKKEKDQFSYGDLIILFNLFDMPDDERLRLLKL